MKKGIVQKMLNRVGMQVKLYPDNDLKRRLKIIHHQGVNTLLDIGAATGEYAMKMREIGFQNRIVSFEPLQGSFAILQKQTQVYRNWEAFNYALGNEESKLLINVAGNNDSSSLLNMLPVHEISEPNSRYIKQEEIQVKRLDDVCGSFCSPNETLMMKIDVQGYEKNVLEGASRTLNQVKVIQLELSLVPLYENQPLFSEMIEFLQERGYRLFSLENGFANLQTGQLLQVDGIFVRE